MADSAVMKQNPVRTQIVPIRHVRIAASSLAVIGLLFAMLGTFSSTAGASEFPPIPKVTSSQKCIDGDYSSLVTIVMANDGGGVAHFQLLWSDADHGGVHAGGNQDFDVTDPKELTFELVEGHIVTYTVTSTDGAGANFFLETAEVDCRSNPVASIAVTCPSTPAEGPAFEYTYQNDSQIPVDFTFAGSNGPDVVKAGVKDMASPATEIRAVWEDYEAHAEVYADGVLLASLELLIDCDPPNHIVVSKTVVGGTGHPAFDFEVICRPNFDSPTTVVDSFSLHNGESKSVDLPFAYSYCDAHEIDPGPAWTVTEMFNGSPMDAPFEEHYFPNDMNYTLEVTNTAVSVPIPIIPDTIPDSTIPEPTVPEPTIPETTVPVTTSAPEVAVTPASQPAPTAVSPATLARTGSNTASQSVLGLVLLSAGLSLVGASRWYRRRTA